MSWDYVQAVLAYNYFGDEKPNTDSVRRARKHRKRCDKHHCNRPITIGSIVRAVRFSEFIDGVHTWFFCEKCCDEMAQEVAGYLPEGKEQIK